MSKRRRKPAPKKKLSIFQRHYWDVFYTCPKTGQIRFRRYNRFATGLMVLALTIAVTLFTVFAFLSVHFFRQYQSVKNKVLDQEEISSELTALNHKLRDVSETLKEVRYFENKINQVTTRVDERRSETSKSALSKSQKLSYLWFGPTTKSELAASAHLTSLDTKSLQLYGFFQKIQRSSMETDLALDTLKKYLVRAENKNLKMQFVPDLAPVRGYLSSTFGYRTSPFTGRTKMHWGIDLAAPKGSPIYATANGKVVRVAKTPDYGNVVDIKHKGYLLTRYAHTKEIFVHKGDRVKKGDIVAAVGETGHATGPHVHYEIEVNGRRVNPKQYIVIW